MAGDVTEESKCCVRIKSLSATCVYSVFTSLAAHSVCDMPDETVNDGNCEATNRQVEGQESKCCGNLFFISQHVLLSVVIKVMCLSVMETQAALFTTP